MFTATNLDRPAFNTRSKTLHLQSANLGTEPSSIQPIKEIVMLDLTTVETTQDITLKPLTADRHEAYYRCRRWIHFVNAPPDSYQMKKHHSMKQIYLYM